MAVAQPWTIDQLQVGQSATVTFSVSGSDMQRFAAVSGDYNPLHTDAEFARARGFAREVVYGGLLVAKISQLIGMQLPGRDAVWASVSLRFHHPLLVDEPAEATGEIAALSPATGLISLRLRVSTGERLLAKGAAEVVLGR